MPDFNMLEHVKLCLGLEGNDYHNNLLSAYIQDVQLYLQDAGIPATVTESRACGGVVARGVADLWNYGAGGAALSPFFKERAAQLALKWGVTANAET